MGRRKRLEAAAEPAYERQIAEALRVGVERDGQNQRGDDEDQRGQREQQQIASTRPTLIGVQQFFAALFGALLPVGERAKQEDTCDEGEQNVVDDEGVPPEQHRPDDRAAHDQTKAERGGQTDTRLRGGQRGRQHRPRTNDHRAENEDDKQRHRGKAPELKVKS